MIEIREITEVTPDLVAAFERLTPQLSSTAPAPTADELEAIVRSDSSTLLVAVDTAVEGQAAIVGTMTLAMFRIPTGVRAWIEDVVVDEAARGRGVGSQMNRRALQIAERRGARTVELTSRPSRETANRLYRRLGFVVRDTNVYRYQGAAS